MLLNISDFNPRQFIKTISSQMLKSILRTGQKVQDWGGPEKRGDGSSVFESWGRLLNFQLPTGMGHPVFFLTKLAYIWHRQQSISFSSKGQKLFKPWLKKYTWQVYIRDENFKYCKICTKDDKSTMLSKESQGRNFQNTTLCQHAGLQGHQMTNFCLHAFCPPE